MRILKALILVFLLCGTAYAGPAFDPGDYPFIYTSGATPGATPTAGSGVIKASGTTMAVFCEFYNSSASVAYYTIYAAGTVAAQAPSNVLCATQCQAATFCMCSGPQVSGPSNNGGLISGSGLSWGSAPYFPGPTASPNPVSWAACTYR